MASPRSGIVHHLSGPGRHALTQTLHIRSRSVDTAPHKSFKHSLTLFSKSFSSFPCGTCSLSVSRPYLALDEIYRPIRAAFPNNPTCGQHLVLRQGLGQTGLSHSLAPHSRRLGPGPSLRMLLQTIIRAA
ncbi:hypothetical protein KSP40_PGU002642 [Platanthera guangdongensis]|uniref:Uncharacterized protein n=1 Tax=Platanthera guangdongensis TaxID=2320717 RepID=A0ABR2M163_9ASPA